MSKLALKDRVPRVYDAAVFQEIVRLLEQQENSHAEGRIIARHGAMTAAPTSGNYVKGDITWDSAPSKTNGSVRIGWICTVSGTPGTWEEVRVLVANFGQLTNTLSGDVALNNTANYFDGPSTAQGTSGTWFASGTVTVTDGSSARIVAKLWDGTTVIASAEQDIPNAGDIQSISLSGFITNPAANIRISCRDISTAGGSIKFNASGNSKDSTLTVIRIG